MSEVRVPHAGMPGITRAIKSKGYTPILSHSPPPAPTFAASPGGVGVLIREPHRARKLHVAVLKRWEEMGRVIVCQMTGTSHAPIIIIIAVYSFSSSHALNCANEEMLADVFHFASSLNAMALIAGDLNEITVTCSTLALVRQWDLWKIASDEPTTKGKKKWLAGNRAIDHAICNNKMKDMGLKMDVSYDFSLSDHWPLVRSFRDPKKEPLLWRRWPQPVDLPKDMIADPEWEGKPTTLTQWSVAARSWLQKAYDVVVPPKEVVASSLWTPKQVAVDPKLSAVCAAQRSLSVLLKSGDPPPKLQERLRRRLFALGLQDTPIDDLQGALDDVLKTYLQQKQKESLREWRQSVKAWHPVEADLFRYLRNPAPGKACAVLANCALTSDAHELKALREYWSNLESWEDTGVFQKACEEAEDKYAMFAPDVPADVELQGSDLHMHVATAKKVKSRT